MDLHGCDLSGNVEADSNASQGPTILRREDKGRLAFLRRAARRNTPSVTLLCGHGPYRPLMNSFAEVPRKIIGK